MRKYYLDNIRWITIVAVVVYHVIYMYNGVGIVGVLGKITDLEVQYYDVYQYIVFPWFMFLLFLVAGISSRIYLENHTPREYVKSRTVKLLVPSTIGLFAFQFIQGYYNTMLSNAGDVIKGVPAPVAFLILIASGIGVLWFIQLLWVFSMLLVPIMKLDKDRLWNLGGKAGIAAVVLFVVPVFGAAQILNTPVICVYRFGYYGIAFLLGYFVFSHDEVIEVLKKWFPALLALAVVLGAAFSYKYFGMNYADGPVNRTVLFVSFGWFASMAFLGGAAKYLNYTNTFMSFMSRHCWGLYVFHYLGISMVAHHIAGPGLVPAWAVYVLSLIAGFALPFVLEPVISRLPFFRWAVLGKK